jgi:hypothetical protein
MALLALVFQSIQVFGQQPSDAATGAPYLRAGQAAQDRTAAYRERFSRFYQNLREIVARSAPDLSGKLVEPPSPTIGYQILPKITTDLARPAVPQRVISNTFSWPLLHGRLERAETRLANVEGLLASLTAEPGDQKNRTAVEVLVNEYVGLNSEAKLIDSQLQYNRLWQSEIDRRKDVYDRFTYLHGAVIERQRIADRRAQLLAEVTAQSAATDSAAEEIARLKVRDEELRHEIQEETGRVNVPSVLSVEPAGPGKWVVHVPLFTDIVDSVFVATFKQAVENAWYLKDGSEEFRLVLSIYQIDPTELYRHASDCPATGCTVPPAGEPLDLNAHVALFPPEMLVLTTGANLTHVNGRSIRLGPQDISANVLAHEFGHLLGFQDGYFRGYHDLGEDGYEVLEVVIDPTDIMSAPGLGSVQRYHFESLIGR